MTATSIGPPTLSVSRDARRFTEVIFTNASEKFDKSDLAINITASSLSDADSSFSTTAGFRRRFVVSSGFSGLAAGGGGASVTKRARPRDQAAEPKSDARAG